MKLLTKHLVGYDELIKVPKPIQTKSYKPVAHETLVQLTREGAKNAGFQIQSESYTVALDGKIATAYYDISQIGDLEMGMRIAWQNSYNKMVTLKFAIGGSVFVCANGCFSGSLGGFKKKHTGDVQSFTPEKIESYFKSAEGIFTPLIAHKEKLKQIDLPKKVCAEIIGDLYINEQLLKETQISIIKKEIMNPSFNYGAPGSAWELYNHVTHSLKTVTAGDYIDSHQKLHRYFDNMFDLEPHFV